MRKIVAIVVLLRSTIYIPDNSIWLAIPHTKFRQKLSFSIRSKAHFPPVGLIGKIGFILLPLMGLDCIYKSIFESYRV